MIRQPEAQRLQRLAIKTIDQVFIKRAQEGLSCSLFEAQALTDLVRDVYFPYLAQPEALQAGQLAIIAVSAREPGHKPLARCKMVPIVLTLHAAPPPLHRAGSGPWVRLVVRNTARTPLTFCYAERTGGEFGFRIRGLEQTESARGPGEVQRVSWIRTTELAPGAQLGFVCDVSRWIRFPGPGAYTITAEHVPFGTDSHWCHSNPLAVRVEN